MKRRTFLRGLTISTLGAMTPLLAGAKSADQPNIILMMADDMGWGDVGFNGSKIVKTPCLDAMSDNGLKLTRFYAGAPVCSPTRGSALTGRNPFRYGIYTANKGHLKEEEISLPEVLKEKGYATGHFGKWHLGTLTPDFSGKGAGRNAKENYLTPGMSGFDEWFSTEFAVATWDPYDPANSHVAKNKPFDPRVCYWENGQNVKGPLTGDDSKIIMDRAIPFIEKSAKQKRPFFTVIWFHAPHMPVVGGPEFLAMYPDYSEDKQHYYACITALDVQVGRLREKLRELDVAENTMVCFCSDNGPEGNPGPKGRSQGTAGPYRGRKRSLYEGGVRVPGIIEWPARIAKSRQSDMPCVTSDYFPTVLEAVAMDMPKPRPYDGISLLPLIDGKMKTRTNPIGFQFAQQASLVEQRYKLVHNPSGKRQRHDNGKVPVAEFELYDLKNDPQEKKNIAPQNSERVERMKKMLAEWQASCKKSDEGADYEA